ncbi:MAG: YfhO family protein [Bacteroidota bacterium]
MSINTEKNFFSRFIYVFLLIGISGLAFWQIIFFIHPVKYDMIDCYYPWRYFIGECLQNGKFPFWNPYQDLGYPIHADPASGAWYPFVWIIGYFGGYTIYTLGLEFWIHIFLAAIGFYKLAKTLNLSQPVSFIAAICFMLSGIFIGNTQHLGFVISACWLPFIINYYLKICEETTYINSVKAAFFMFLLITGGYPAFTIILFYLLLIFFFYYGIKILRDFEKKEVLKFLARNSLFLFLTLLLCSGILLSVYEVMPYITRTSQFTIAKALNGPFSPQSSLSFLLPFATTKNVDFFATDFALSNAYFGILMFLFFVLGVFLRKPFQYKIFSGFGLFSLAAAFGNYLPVREFLYNYVPGMNIFRFPSIFRLFTIISFILIGAFWLENFMQNDFEKNRRKIKNALIFLLVILISSVLVARLTGYLAIADFVKHDLFIFSKTSTISQHIAFQAIVQTIVVGLFLILVFKVNDKSRFLKYATAIIIFELIFSAQLNEPYTTYYGEFSAKAATNHIKKFPSGFPQLPDIALADVNPNEVYFGPFWRNVGAFQKQISAVAYNSFVFTGHEFFRDKTLPFYNNILKNKVVFLSDEIAEEKTMETHIDSAFTSKTLFFNKKVFDQLNKTILESTSGDTAHLVYFAPDSFIVNTSTKSKQIITLLQNNYKGWEVFINQQPTTIYTSNKSTISVILPPGQNSVSFIYHNRGIMVALWVSIITMGVCILIIVVSSIKNNCILIKQKA